jgi:hypothetical protein
VKIEEQINILLLKHELIKATDIQEFKYGSTKPITLADDIKDLVMQVRRKTVEEVLEDLDGLPWPKEGGMKLSLLPTEWANIAKRVIRAKYLDKEQE